MSSAPVKRGSTPVLLILLGSMFLAPRVEAQKTPPDTSRARSRYVLEGLVIKGLRLATTVGGSSAIRIRIDSIRGVPVPTLEQLLQDMPLVQTRTNSRGEVQPALRGSGDRQIAILVDGVPLTLGWDHRTDLSVIPLTAARGVTLLRGLRSVLYGPNVLGGVIEIDVGRGASRDEAPNPLLLHSALDETGGTVLGLTGGVLREREGRQWVVRGGGGYRERSGFRLPSKVDDVGNIAFLTRDGEHRLNSDFRHYDGFLSVRYIDGEGEWLSLSTSGYRVERGVPPETHGVEPRLWRYPEQNRLLAAFSAGTGHRDTPWGSGGLELSIGVDRGHNEIRSFASPAFERLDETEFGDDRTLTFRLTGDHSLRGSGTLKTAVTLADVAHDEKFVPGASAGYRQRLWSFGSELEWTSDDLSWIPWRGTTSFSFGLVVDGSDTPEAGDKPPVGRLWDGGGRFGMTSSALEGRVIVNGGVSRRSRFPALRELYSGALGRFQPNPALRAEVLTAGEVGFTLGLGTGELQVVGFHHRLADGIVRITVGTEEGTKFQRVNRSEIRSTGLEFVVNGHFGSLGYAADLTLQRTRLHDEDALDHRLEYEPVIVGRTRASLPLIYDAHASGELRFVGQQLCRNPDLGRLDVLDPSARTDLDLSRSFALGERRVLSRLEAMVAVDNVGDATIFDQCGLPQPGRTFRLQIRIW